MSRRVSFIHGSGSAGGVTPAGSEGPWGCRERQRRYPPRPTIRTVRRVRPRVQTLPRLAHFAQRKWFLSPTLRTSAPEAPHVEHGMIPRATASFRGIFSTSPLYGGNRL